MDNEKVEQMMIEERDSFYLSMLSSLCFLKNGFFIDGEIWFCMSSLAAEFGVGNADGMDVGMDGAMIMDDEFDVAVSLTDTK